MEYLESIIDKTIDSFDFGLIVSINIATYIIVKVIEDFKKEKIGSWYKRLIMIIVGFIISTVYIYNGDIDYKLTLNSLILTPVFWRWFGKPIVKKFGIGYNSNDCG